MAATLPPEKVRDIRFYLRMVERITRDQRLFFGMLSDIAAHMGVTPGTIRKYALEQGFYPAKKYITGKKIMCLYCKKHEFTHSKSMFCSPECKKLYQEEKTYVKIPCTVCQTVVKRKKKGLVYKNTKNVFCTRKCTVLFQRKENQARMVQRVQTFLQTTGKEPFTIAQFFARNSQIKGSHTDEYFFNFFKGLKKYQLIKRVGRGLYQFTLPKETV